jgi:hypothetical protein
MNTTLLYRNILLFMALGLFLQTCEKDPEPLTTNSAITGNVYWYDGNDEGKFTITARGPYGSKSIEGDNWQDFIIDKLGNGTYCVEFSKEGYGTYVRCNVQLFGNDTVRVPQVELLQKPADFEMPVLTGVYISYPDFSFPPSPILTIETDANDKNMCPSLMFFFSRTADVSWNKYQGFQSGWHQSFDPVKKVWLIYLDTPFLNGIQVHSGEIFYLMAYACGLMDRGYLDTSLGIEVFSTLDKKRSSNVLDFTLP